MGKLFVPFVYVPSAESPTVTLVTPWGSLRVNKQLALQLVVSVAVLLVSAWAWRCAARSRRSTSKDSTAEGQEEDEDEEEEEEEEEEEDPVPDESFVQKGQHSYYYAHQQRDGGKAGADDSAVQKTVVSTYGWTDNKETINIYLTDKAVVRMDASQLVLDWTKSSLSLDLLSAPGGKPVKSLVISALFGEITDISWRAEADQLQITLTKAKAGTWKSLNGAAKHMEEHIEYDESLYD